MPNHKKLPIHSYSILKCSPGPSHMIEQQDLMPAPPTILKIGEPFTELQPKSIQARLPKTVSRRPIYKGPRGNE